MLHMLIEHVHKSLASVNEKIFLQLQHKQKNNNSFLCQLGYITEVYDVKTDFSVVDFYDVRLLQTKSVFLITCATFPL